MPEQANRRGVLNSKGSQRALLSLVIRLGAVVLVSGGGLCAYEQQWEPLLKEGDSLAKQHQSREALGKFQPVEKLCPESASILSRMSEQAGDLAAEEHSEGFARKSLDYAQRAVSVDPSSSTAHINLAIAYGRVTDFTDNRTKLEYSKEIKKEAESALRLDPKNALAAHVLGRWHQGIASLNPLLRAMAQMIYGGMPPASMKEAIDLLKQAVDLDPRCIMYRFELARAYESNAQPLLAKPQCEEILRLPLVEKSDFAAKDKARAALWRINR